MKTYKPFQVGETCANHTGAYTVLAVSTARDEMRVRYEDGSMAVLPYLANQRQIADNVARKATMDAADIAKSQNEASGLDQPAFCYLVGWLAVRATQLDVRVPPNRVESFTRRYRDITGEGIVWGQNHCYLLDKVKRGPDTRIVLRATQAEIDALSLGILQARPHSESEGRYEIASNDLTYILLKLGFRPGCGVNVERIRRSIPAPYLTRFEQGVADAASSRAE